MFQELFGEDGDIGAGAVNPEYMRYSGIYPSGVNEVARRTELVQKLDTNSDGLISLEELSVILETDTNTNTTGSGAIVGSVFGGLLLLAATVGIVRHFRDQNMCCGSCFSIETADFRRPRNRNAFFDHPVFDDFGPTNSEENEIVFTERGDLYNEPEHTGLSGEDNSAKVNDFGNLRAKPCTYTSSNGTYKAVVQLGSPSKI